MDHFMSIIQFFFVVEFLRRETNMNVDPERRVLPFPATNDIRLRWRYTCVDIRRVCVLACHVRRTSADDPIPIACVDNEDCRTRIRFVACIDMMDSRASVLDLHILKAHIRTRSISSMTTDRKTLPLFRSLILLER